MTRDPHITRFRRLALQLPEAVESAHMGHPDFRLNNRIFATLSAQEKGYGVLKLTPEQQRAFITDQPSIFSLVQGGWGRMGMTFIQLNQADESIMAGALQTAYRNLQQKQSQKEKPALKQKKSAKSSKPAKATRSPLQ
jgi:YjbR